MTQGQAAPIIPKLTLDERDRRYRLVRQRMADAHLDVLILPPNTGRWEQNMADSRYLTTIGGFGTETLTVFPREADATAYVYNRAAFWKSAQDWVGDVRDGRNRWAENIAERLGEIGFSRGRIGIAGLSGLTRSPDGIVAHWMVKGLTEAFPAAEIVNATALMREARSIKSAEEIALIRRATGIAEAMVETLRSLRPGTTERTMYGGLVAALLKAGGELPAMILVGSGPDIAHGNFVPTDRVLRRNDLIVGEVEGRYCGYSGQIVRPAVLGEATPDYRSLVRIAQACFEDVVDAMKPGVTLGAVADIYERSVARHGGGRCAPAYPLLHARGLGDEEPAIIDAKDRDRLADVELRPGMVFVLKPRVLRDGTPGAQIGDTVAVDERNARRLGQNSLDIIEVDWPTAA